MSLLLVACSSMVVAGSRPHEGAPAQPLGVYIAPQCTLKVDGSTTKGLNSVYYLVRDNSGLSLLELDEEGSGLAMDNYWFDSEGHHFATYIKGGAGSNIIIPEDRSKQGVLAPDASHAKSAAEKAKEWKAKLGILYRYTSYQVIPTGTGFRLQGQADKECELRPVGKCFWIPAEAQIDKPCLPSRFGASVWAPMRRGPPEMRVQAFCFCNPPE